MATKAAPIEIYPIEAETLCRSLGIQRSLTVKERDAIDSVDFAWPEEEKYPIDTQAHLDAAAKLIGRAPESVQAKIKKNAIRIARKNKLKLPDSWLEEDGSDDKEDRAAMATPDPLASQDTPSPHELMTGKHSHHHAHDIDGYSHEHEHEHSQDAGHDHAHHHSLSRAANHEPFKGTHKHAHPAMNSQGDDSTHEHEHSHDGDNSHEHEHSEDRAAMPTKEARLNVPIVRFDPAKWEVEGVATSEEVDSFGTIFSYEASKTAFKEWSERCANVREMHDKKAVGKGINWWPDDEKKEIHVQLRVSRGARDTWLKIEDGVLDGLSVGATEPVWGTTERNGKSYPYLKSYKLAELSLVDNASNPSAQGLIIARADGLGDLVDIEEATPSVAGSLAPSSSSVVERAGARVSAPTRDAMHDSIKHGLHSVAGQMKNCGCDTCCSAMAMIDPDGDGDIDLGGYDDPDGDWQSLYNKNDGDMDRMVATVLERVEHMLPEVVERVLLPVYRRQQQFLARMAQTPEFPEITIPSFDTTALETRINTALERVAADVSSLSEVRASLTTQMTALEAVKETVERIEKQPMPGGPVLNGGGMPVDKRLANQPQASNPAVDQAAMRTALDRLQAAGALNTIEAQTAAASLMIQPMPGRRG